MKKILFYETTGSGSGSTVCLQMILCGLDRSLYDPVLLFGNKGNQAKWKGYEVHEYNGSSLDNCDFSPPVTSPIWWYRFIRFFFLGLKELLYLPMVLRKIQPDVVHLNCGQAIVMGVICHSMGIPVVWHIRELVRENWLGRLQDVVYARCADRVVAISKAVSRRLVACNKRDKIVQIYDGVMPFEWRSDYGDPFELPADFQRSDFVVLLLGTISESKGYGFLADVARHLVKYKNISFVLAGGIYDKPTGRVHSMLRILYRRLCGGSGKLRVDKEKIIKKWANIISDGQAIFPGRLNAGAAIEYADIIVCPNSVPEPLGLTVLEAYLKGKPVLAMKQEAFNETVIDGETGYLLPPDPKIWTQKLIDLASHVTLRTKLGESARLEADKYDVRTHVRKLCSIYDHIGI